MRDLPELLQVGLTRLASIDDTPLTLRGFFIPGRRADVLR
jgi:hypothetical protein